MTDQARLARSEAHPPLLRLHHALSRLSSVLTVMNTGAHPDDEQSGMLAWLRFGQGMRIVIACSTRGEGGQNILGPERGGLLGMVRTREMEEAARVLDCDIAWLGHGPDDPVHDFGFSKDGDQTLARWGETRIIARLAEAYRRWRPDVVIPTFLDVPGQHGHHRAMTRAAEAAIPLAAQAAPGDAPPAWQVSRFYLPAWSGAGGTYDDTEPPPPATLRITASGVDAATGAPFAEIGEWSRRRHASQGMGHWQDDPRSGWSLHWKAGGEEAVLAEGLPRDLAGLARIAGPAEGALADAAGAVLAAIAAFPDGQACLGALADARNALDAAERAADAGFRELHGHRLARKRREIDAAMAEAAGLRIWAEPGSRRIAPGGAGVVKVSVSGPAFPLNLRPVLPPGAASTPTQLQAPGKANIPVTVASDAPDSPQFLPCHDVLGGNDGGYVAVSARIAGVDVALTCDLDPPLSLRPASGPALRPDAVLMTRDASSFPLTLIGESDGLTLDLPPGWSSARQGERIILTPPKTLPEGLTPISAIRNVRPVLAEATGDYPHIGAFSLARPAVLRFLRLDLVLPEGARVAYVRGTDDTGPWLARMGIDVTILDSIEPGEDFSAYTTVLAGVVAFGARPDLAASVPALHRFVAAGGHLVSFYQRPDQGWDAASTPPGPLTVGTPSVRWRVTDPDAPVTILAPDHPLLTGPNAITAEDFAGWHKERGLYFASSWDPAYTPLVALSDPGEAPLTGALLSGRFGKGRHTHCALVLHHQVEHLVPGAFRLLANLLQPA